MVPKSLYLPDSELEREGFTFGENSVYSSFTLHRGQVIGELLFNSISFQTINCFFVMCCNLGFWNRCYYQRKRECYYLGLRYYASRCCIYHLQNKWVFGRKGRTLIVSRLLQKFYFIFYFENLTILFADQLFLECWNEFM